MEGEHEEKIRLKKKLEKIIGKEKKKTTLDLFLEEELKTAPNYDGIPADEIIKKLDNATPFERYPCCSSIIKSRTSSDRYKLRK